MGAVREAELEAARLRREAEGKAAEEAEYYAALAAARAEAAAAQARDEWATMGRARRQARMASVASTLEAALPLLVEKQAVMRRCLAFLEEAEAERAREKKRKAMAVKVEVVMADETRAEVVTTAMEEV